MYSSFLFHDNKDNKQLSFNENVNIICQSALDNVRVIKLLFVSDGDDNEDSIIPEFVIFIVYWKVVDEKNSLIGTQSDKDTIKIRFHLFRHHTP